MEHANLGKLAGSALLHFAPVIALTAGDFFEKIVQATVSPVGLVLRRNAFVRLYQSARKFGWDRLQFVEKSVQLATLRSVETLMGMGISVFSARKLSAQNAPILLVLLSPN